MQKSALPVLAARRFDALVRFQRRHRLAREPARRDARPSRGGREHRFRLLRQAGRGHGRRALPPLLRRARHRDDGDAERELRRRHQGPCRRARRIEQADRAHGPPRHRVPERGGGPAPVPDRQRARLWAGRLRHEGRAGDERFRACGLPQVRRRAGAARRAHHLGRGDRLARLPADHRGDGAERPRGAQLRARATLRQRRDRPQGRRLHEDGGRRQGRPLRRQLRAGRERHRRARAQDRRAACDHRHPARHDGERRADLRRAVGQHRRARGRVPDRPPLHHAARPRRRHAPHRGDRRPRDRAGHLGDARDQGRVQAARPGRGRKGAVRHLPGGDAGSRPAARRRVHRRLRRFRASPRASAARRSAPSARSAARRIRRKNTSRSRASCPAPRRWR